MTAQIKHGSHFRSKEEVRGLLGPGQIAVIVKRGQEEYQIFGDSVFADKTGMEAVRKIAVGQRILYGSENVFVVNS